MNKDELKALEAVQKLKDKSKLADASVKAPLEKTRIAAREKLTQIEQSDLLARLATVTDNAIYSDFLSTAFVGQSDQFLGEVSKNISYDFAVRRFAIREIADKTVLREVQTYYESYPDTARAKDISNSIKLRQQELKRQAKEKRAEESQLVFEGVLDAYLNDPNNKHVCDLIYALDDTHGFKTRKRAATELIEIANTTPELIMPIWGWIKAKVEAPCRTYEARLNEFDREEAGLHEEQSSGIGMSFPMKPRA